MIPVNCKCFACHPGYLPGDEDIIKEIDEMKKKDEPPAGRDRISMDEARMKIHDMITANSDNVDFIRQMYDACIGGMPAVVIETEDEYLLEVDE